MTKIVIYFIILTSALEFSNCFNCVPPETNFNLGTNNDSQIFPTHLLQSVEKLLETLEKSENNDYDGVQELINYYKKAKGKKDDFEKTGMNKTFPFIVVEGLAGSGKTTLSNKLAKKINAVYMASPPGDVGKLKHKFLGNEFLKFVYHYLAHYITALEAYVLLNDSPVISDRYWPSSAVYTISRQVYYNQGKTSMPLKGDSVYMWPKDLLKPDVMLFLEVDENIRVLRINGRFNEPVQSIVKRKFEKNEDLLKRCPDYRNNLVLAYKNIQDPEVTLINANLAPEEVFEQAYTKVKPFLKN